MRRRSSAAAARPPSIVAINGISANPQNHPGNDALLPAAPVYAARRTPAPWLASIPSRESVTAGSPPTSRVAVAPIDIASTNTDWFGSSDACSITVAAPLPPVRDTKRA